jgi:hypothetical protein
MKVLMIMGLYNKLHHIKKFCCKCAMFAQHSIHKYTWTSPDRKTPSQVDHILIHRKQRLIVLDKQCFRGTDCDTGHCLVVPKVRMRGEEESNPKV